MGWQNLTFRVTTHMFVAGANNRTEFRVPALRGALRFWFRTLAGAYLFDNRTVLARLEQAVFGGVSEDGPVASRVAFRPSRPLPRPVDEPAPGWLTGHVPYLLGQGLCQWINRDAAPNRFELTRGYLPADGIGELRVRCDPAVAVPVVASLWMLGAYGGLGARIRRGLGGIHFPDLNSLAPEVLQPLPAQTPAVCNPDSGEGSSNGWAATPLQRITGVFADWLHTQQLTDLGATPLAVDRGRTLSPFPVIDPPVDPSRLHGTFWQLQVVSPEATEGVCAEPDSILDFAGCLLRYVRAPVHRPALTDEHRQQVTREYRDVIVPHAGNPAAAAGDPFPVAVLGLPMQYRQGRFKVNLFAGDSERRRPSLIWLRPFQHNDRWRLAVLLFVTEFADGDTHLKLDWQPPGTTRKQDRQRVDLAHPTAPDDWDEHWLAFQQPDCRFDQW